MSENSPKYVKSEEVRPYPKKKKLMGRVISVIVMFALLFVVFFGVRLVSTVFLPYNAKDDSQIVIDIPENSSAGQIGSFLEESKVIRSGFAFKLYVRIFNEADKIQAGKHIVSPKMTLGEIVTTLQSGARASGDGIVAITFPEGLTLENMASVFGNNTKYSAKDFMDVVNDKAFIDKMAEKYPNLLGDVINLPNLKYTLEGYLYPATYDFDQTKGIEPLVESMIAKRASEIAKYEADIKASGHTIHEILTMASLVEREGNSQEDRNNIASTFYNRIAKDMPLQTDISVLYAKGEHKEIVTLTDLEYDSLYNLYKYKGLGPGPFNSPSDSAIIASIYPSKTNYIYFFADLNTGKVFFTDNFEQHLAWQKEYEETGTVKG